MEKHENAFILYKFFLLITINFSNVKISILFLSGGRFYCNIIVKSRRYKPTTKNNKGGFNMIKLNNKIKVVIPKEDNDGCIIDCGVIERSVSHVTNLLGGATNYEGTGYWSSPGGRLMTDNVNVTEWFYDRLELAKKDRTEDLVNMVSWIVFALIQYHGQEAVSVEVDGTLYIIEKSDIQKYNDSTEFSDIRKAKKLIRGVL